MSDTPLLALPLIEAAQAQKHVTHNEALLLLDAAIHLSVISRSLQAPPAAAAADGDRYLVAANATGAWAGQSGRVAVAQGGGYIFLSPRKGWRMWAEAEAKLLVFDGTAWRDASAAPDLSGLARLGINATADDTNRLSVSAAAALFSHAGSDHRLKLNKNVTADTASLLFQTGFAGRAEMGIAGDDDFRVKVSADGAAWKQALVIDRTTGAVSLPNTPVAAAFRMAFAQSLSGQGPGFAADTYLAGSAIGVPAGSLKAGTRYVLAFDVAKTAAGVAAPVITLRFGAAGAIADPALAILTFPAQTALADDGRFTLEATFRSVGAGSAAVVQAVAALGHGQTATGLSVAPGPVRRATSAGFDSTLAAGMIGVSVNGGSAAAWTVSLVQARLENLA